LGRATLGAFPWEADQTPPRGALGVKKVNVHEAKTHFSKLLERAHAGEEVIIAKGGRPYARLCPLEAPKPRQPGLLAGRVDEDFFEPLPDEELEAWER
jgi:prevent-host-death family protein